MKKSKKFTTILAVCCAFLLVSVAGLAISFASYVTTSNRDKETSTVAKFGVSMTWDGAAFDSEYTSQTASSLAVKNAADGKTLAPGTSGAITLTLGGSSEVAINVVIDIEQEYSANWKESAEGPAYNPIVVKAYDITGERTELNIVDGKIEYKSFEAGEAITGKVEITWAWSFEGNNAADTYIGTLGEDVTYAITTSATASQTK